MGIVGNFLRRKKGLPAVQRNTYSAGRHNSSPPLVLLLADASGIASYRYFSFASAQAAEWFVDSHLRGAVTADTVLFWALTERPRAFAEAVVLVMGKNDAAHAFSFTNMDSARSFVRSELSNGLPASGVKVYWASPATLRIDPEGKASVVPRTPPTIEHRDQPRVGTDWTETKVIAFPVPARPSKADEEVQTYWGNLCQALDSVLDAYVARRVSAILAWRVLSREVSAAARLQMLATAAAERRKQMRGDGTEGGTEVDGDGTDSAREGETDGERACDEPGGDDPWFIPRRNWRELSDEPFRGFDSPPGRF